MAKIAISLPDEMLQEIESGRQTTGESRSQFLRRAVEAFLLRQRELEAIEQYVRGYLKDPETDKEQGWVESASQAVLAEYPWDAEAQE